MKRLSYLLRNLSYFSLVGRSDKLINEVEFDYKKIGHGDLYFALIYPGREGNRPSDGHEHIDVAIDQGAIAIVCEHLPTNILENITYIRVEDAHEAMALMIANYYDNPADKLQIIGATGTNGKTSVVTLLHQLFRMLGHRAGLISTVVDKINDLEISTDGTTPNAKELNQLWKQMVEANCKYCFMEVTSHSIFQRRVAMVDFAVSIFTSLSADHIGYHKTFEEYVRVKKSFFDDASADSFVVYNIDDPYAATMIKDSKSNINSISLEDPNSDFYSSVKENTLDGLVLEIDGELICSKLAARFNAYNIITTFAVAVLLGEERKTVLNILPDLSAIPGRFNVVRSKNNIIGVVDFAHNLGALVKLYELLNLMRTRRIITVIGCGGDRDRQRSKIGKLTYEKSDVLILTSDNPRSEEPFDIIRIMTSEIVLDPKKIFILVDRDKAIKHAVEIAEPNDIILLASKGHESYQEIKGVKYPFNDKALLTKYFDQSVITKTIQQ